MTVKRTIILVLCLLLVSLLTTIIVGALTTPEPVYTVADVQMGLQRQPTVWVGRSVLVRGQSVTIALSPSGSAQLVSSHGGPTHAVIPAAGAIFHALIVPVTTHLQSISRVTALQPRLWVYWQLSPPPGTSPLIRLFHRLFPSQSAGAPYRRSGSNNTEDVFRLTILSRRGGGCSPPTMCDDALVVEDYGTP